jgi:hypothetical protein
VSFAQLDQTEEYKHLKLLERVSLFDTVNVEFPALKVSASAKAVKVVYDALANRVKSVTLGSVRANIADTIANQQQEIQQTATKNDVKQAQEIATAWLTNGKGYAYFRKDDLGNIIDILFMDTQDINTAVNVMRVGQSGIGFSHNGVNGLYESAWTIDGRFLADFIQAGQLKSQNGRLIFDLNSGVFTSKASDGRKITITGSFFEYDSKDGTIEVLLSPAFEEDGKTLKGHQLSFANNGYAPLTIGRSGNDAIISCKNLDVGYGVVNKKIGWKTVNGLTYLVADE